MLFKDLLEILIVPEFHVHYGDVVVLSNDYGNDLPEYFNCKVANIFLNCEGVLIITLYINNPS